MPIEKIQIEPFLQLAQEHPVLDVRSPGEYAHAHIPGAYNLPLFTDEERKVVGTAYKQESRETAIKIGLDYFGPKMRPMVEQVEAWAQNHPNPGKTIGVHCWRGGMRSAAIAWLLDLYGFKVYQLTGGYKSFRNYVLSTFEQNFELKILGGFTGSGKTEVLKSMMSHNENVIDLEGIACHKGSAFGNLGQPPQPTQEMFENLLALELRTKGGRPIWLEDESQRIGHVNVPAAFWLQMRRQPLYFLEIPFEERLEFIVEHYGGFDREELEKTILRIQKRLGGLETKTALQFLAEGNIKDCFGVLLKYYDKWYNKSLHNRDDLAALLYKIPTVRVKASINARLLQEAVKRETSSIKNQ